MKIVHIAPCAPYNDYWGYQDNLLPKYQKKLGHDVTVIITNTMHKDGKIVETDCGDYMLNDGVRVIRLKVKQYPHIVWTNMCSKLPVYKYLADIKPDFIFVHGLQGTTIFDAIHYQQRINRLCVIVRDNHLDYNICRVPGGVKGWLLRSFQRTVNRIAIPYVSRVYGVTPWRKTYAEDYFHIPHEKTDVLIMGADDEKIDYEHRQTIRQRIRDQYGVKDTEFLIVTGGKIDTSKNIHVLMKAVSHIDSAKLLIFGRINEDIQAEFDKCMKESNNIIFIGWIDSDTVYNYFFAADLVFFPGQHSVLWEQACAAKVPCMFEEWEGMDHVNNGGNAAFIPSITVQSIQNEICSLLFTEKYWNMKNVAESGKTDIYLYSNIAKKSLECIHEK